MVRRGHLQISLLWCVVGENAIAEGISILGYDKLCIA